VSLVFVVLPVCFAASVKLGLLSAASFDMIESAWERYAGRFKMEIVQRKIFLKFEMGHKE
jgi:hypothetical protein